MCNRLRLFPRMGSVFSVSERLRKRKSATTLGTAAGKFVQFSLRNSIRFSMHFLVFCFLSFFLSVPIPSEPNKDAVIRVETTRLSREIQTAILRKDRPRINQLRREMNFLFPNAPETLFCNGLIFYSEENFLESEKSLKQTLSLNDTHEVAHFLLGSIYYKQNKLELAEAAFQRAVEISPYNPFYFWNFALTLYANQDYEQALLVLNRTKELKKNYDQVDWLKAKIFFHRKEFERFEELCKEFLLTPDDNKLLRLEWARYKLLVANDRKSVEEYMKSLKRYTFEDQKIRGLLKYQEDVSKEASYQFYNFVPGGKW